MRTDGLVYYGNLYKYYCDRHDNDRMLIFKAYLSTSELKKMYEYGAV